MTLDSPTSRERLVAYGSRDLTDEELVGLLLGTGRAGEGVRALARSALLRLGDLRSLAEAPVEELMQIGGIGSAKAARFLAAVELGRRVAQRRWERGQPFRSAVQVFEHLHPWLRDEKQECFLGLFLDARNRFIGEKEISRGTLVASLVHPREVFRPAVRMAAASLICVHNHPSGDCGVSAEDLAITRRLHGAGQLLGVEILDHIVIGDGEFTSFLDRGLPPFDRGRLRSDPAERSLGERP